MILRAFAPAIRAELPFLMPTVAGTVRQGALSTFVYAHLAGATRSIEELSSCNDALAKEIGTALAAVHDLPQSLVNNADLPSYTANEFRQRKLNELDQAATTGKIPPSLLRRWEHALEDVALWRFNPCVVHGDLHEDNLLIDGDSVTALTGWTDLRIGDPADDFAWLVASNEQRFVESVLRHYTEARRDTPDGHLLRRSALLAEFALAQYLVKAMAAGHSEMTGEAEGMLKSLADDIEEQNALAAEEAEAAAAELAASDDGPAQPAVSVTAIPEAVQTNNPETAATTPPVTVEPLDEAAVDKVTKDKAHGEEAASGFVAVSDKRTGSTPEAPSESDDTSTKALQVVEPAPLQDAKDR